MKSKVITIAIGASVTIAGVAALSTIIKKKRNLKKTLEKERELLKISEDYISYLEVLAENNKDRWQEEWPEDYIRTILHRINSVNLCDVTESESGVLELRYDALENPGYDVIKALISAMNSHMRLSNMSIDDTRCISERLLFNSRVKDLENAVESIKAHLECFK